MSDQFSSARLKLTLWYLSIIVIISSIFSATIFLMISRQIEQQYRESTLKLRAFQFGIEIPPGRRLDIPELRELKENIEDKIELEYQDQLNEDKKTVRNKLAQFNLIIFFMAGASGYFLSGITLDPIKKTMQNQKRFISDASHELKTPITALKTSLEVNLLNKNLDKNAKKILKSNLEDVNSLQKLTQNLLDLAKFSRGKLDLEDINIKDIITKVHKKFLPLANKKKIDIKLNVKSKIIEADSQKIEELISIFLDNAIKYTNKEGKICLTSNFDKKYLYIKIKDNGIGIDKDDQDHIFDRFYRVDKSRSKNNSHGFGLGLSIANNIIKAHKGTIHLKSEEKKGSEFTLKFPLKN